MPLPGREPQGREALDAARIYPRIGHEELEVAMNNLQRVRGLQG
jgi:hypothetical protein